MISLHGRKLPERLPLSKRGTPQHKRRPHLTATWCAIMLCLIIAASRVRNCCMAWLPRGLSHVHHTCPDANAVAPHLVGTASLACLAPPPKTKASVPC